HPRELLAVTRHHQQTHAVVVQPDLGDVIFAEKDRGDAGGIAAADEVLARVLLDLVAHRADGAFGDDHPVGDQHDLIADQIHFLEDMTREDDVLAFARPGAEQRDRLGPHQRVEAVQRLVEHEQLGIVRDRLRQAHALPHALRIPRHLPVRRLGQAQALERLPRFLFRFRAPVSEQQQPGRDERESGRPARRRVVLRGVPGDAHQRFGIARRDPAHEDLAVVGMDQAGHQVHQCGLARAVRADQARDARRDVQRHPVDAEYLAVELRDFVEDHTGGLRPAGPPYTLTRSPLRRLTPFAWLARCRSLARLRRCHDTTSTGRSLRSITTTSSRTIAASAHAEAAAPGPSIGATPSSARQTWLTAHAGSMMCPHLTRSTLSIISAMPLRMKKKARLTAAATTFHRTYAELAIATRLRTSSHIRNPATMPAPSVQFALNHEPPASPTCNPNRISPGIHVTIDSMPTSTVSRASA